jgi:hypothetical protein
MRVSNFGILACIILVVASIYKVLWKSRVFPDLVQIHKSTYCDRSHMMCDSSMSSMGCPMNSR